jgi:hypothetical protein
MFTPTHTFNRYVSDTNTSEQELHRRSGSPVETGKPIAADVDSILIPITFEDGYQDVAFPEELTDLDTDEDEDDAMTMSEAVEQYNEYLNSGEWASAGGQQFAPSDVLRALDPIAYRTGFSDWADSEGIDTDDLEDDGDGFFE